MTEPTVPGGTHPFEAPAAPTAAPGVLTDPTPPTTATTPPEGPQPLLKGSFAIYLTPEHAMVLAYRPEGTTDDRQFLVPPFVIDMAARQSGQTPQQLITRLQEGLS